MSRRRVPVTRPAVYDGARRDATWCRRFGSLAVGGEPRGYYGTNRAQHRLAAWLRGEETPPSSGGRHVRVVGRCASATYGLTSAFADEAGARRSPAGAGDQAFLALIAALRAARRRRPLRPLAGSRREAERTACVIAGSALRPRRRVETLPFSNEPNARRGRAVGFHLVEHLSYLQAPTDGYAQRAVTEGEVGSSIEADG